MSSVQAIATVMIIVEGKTELTFVRYVLAPIMATKGIQLIPTIIGKPGHKGGDVRFELAKNDIGNSLKQRSNTYVSTMFDYFRIGTDWPGLDIINRKKNSGATVTANEKALTLEEATKTRIKALFPDLNVENRFIPYIEMHEFEALLFSDAYILAEKIGINLEQIKQIIDEYSNPEEINDRPEHAPSKRLMALVPDYQKVFMGKTISKDIGIPAIRAKCPHFDEWLKKLENLNH